MAQPLWGRGAAIPRLRYELSGQSRSQIGCGRDHPMDRDLLLPSDLDRAKSARVGLAFCSALGEVRFWAAVRRREDAAA